MGGRGCATHDYLFSSANSREGDALAGPIKRLARRWCPCGRFSAESTSGGRGSGEWGTIGPQDTNPFLPCASSEVQEEAEPEPDKKSLELQPHTDVASRYHFETKAVETTVGGIREGRTDCGGLTVILSPAPAEPRAGCAAHGQTGHVLQRRRRRRRHHAVVAALPLFLRWVGALGDVGF